MTSFQQQPVSAIADDSGADTLRRFYAQIEYTAYWCIRLLVVSEGLQAVVPETVEDVVLVRADRYELHQVKTRDESRGPWTLTELQPILSKLFIHRGVFDKPCSFCFVSNQLAENTRQRGNHSPPSLYRLKSLLEARAMSGGLQPDEQVEYDAILQRVVPTIIQSCPPKTSLTEADCRGCLAVAQIDTQSNKLHYPNVNHEHSPTNIQALGDALQRRFPGHSPPTFVDCARIYRRLIDIVLQRVRGGQTFDERRITEEHVLDCRAEAAPAEPRHPEIAAAPGATLLDKKFHLAGFDTPRREAMHRQKAEASTFVRRLPAGDSFDALNRLILTLVDHQESRRQEVIASQPDTGAIGEAVLSRVRTELPALSQRCFPTRQDVDDHVCLGLLWEETGQCRALSHWVPATGVAVEHHPA